MKRTELSPRAKGLLVGLQLVLGSLIILIAVLLVTGLSAVGKIISGGRPDVDQASQYTLLGANASQVSLVEGNFQLHLNVRGAVLKAGAIGWLLSVALLIAALVLIFQLVNRLRRGEFFVQANMTILHRLLGVVGAMMLLDYLALFINAGATGLAEAVAMTALTVGIYVITALFSRGFDLMQEGARMI